MSEQTTIKEPYELQWVSDVDLIKLVYDRTGPQTAEELATRMGYRERCYCEACEADVPYTEYGDDDMCLICWSKVEPKPRMYNHMFTIAFSMVTPHSCEGDDYPSDNEFAEALSRRLMDIERNASWLEACGSPNDTYVEEGE